MSEIQPIPQHVRDSRPWAEIRVMDHPSDMTNDECGPAQMQFSLEEVSPGRPWPHWYAHFKLTADELAALQSGGTVELCILGERPQPFSLTVWPAAPSPAVAAEGAIDVEHTVIHRVEVFGDEDHDGWGWQCFTCGREQVCVGTLAEAEAAAAVHGENRYVPEDQCVACGAFIEWIKDARARNDVRPGGIVTMPRRRRSSVARARRTAHQVEVLLGDVRAVQTGRIVPRIFNRLLGRAIGRTTRSWWR